MKNSLLARLHNLGLVVLCAGSMAACGCAESGNLGMAAHHPGENRARTVAESPASEPAANPASIEVPTTPEATNDVVGEQTSRPSESSSGDPAPSETVATEVNAKPADPVPANREFVVEGPDKALRVGFDDLDLLKILRMDPVTADCVDRMPAWLRGLDGKTVRIRGFMKPGLLLEGIPQFMFVRDTGLCCFGPKGKIYDMIAVTLKEGTTTNYIELRPFDVVGKFRIELLQLEDDGTIFGLYYIDDARIIQK